jgi:hypothetical protein
MFSWRGTCFDGRAENCNCHKVNLVLVIGYFKNGRTVFVENLNSENMESYPFWIDESKSIEKCLSRTRDIVLNKAYHIRCFNQPFYPCFTLWQECNCKIATKITWDTQKGVGRAFVEIIRYLIAPYADNVKWHSLKLTHKNVHATAATNKYDPSCNWRTKIPQYHSLHNLGSLEGIFECARISTYWTN